MTTQFRANKIAAGLLSLICALALAAMTPLRAPARGETEAMAFTPVYRAADLRLVGRGYFATQVRHVSISVKVCLYKRYGARFFEVRCETANDVDRKVRALVTVPGCVEGVWRTTAKGTAKNRRGEVVHRFSRSAPFRCPSSKS